MNPEGSEAEEDLGEEAEVKAEDVSTRSHLRVHTSKKR